MTTAYKISWDWTSGLLLALYAIIISMLVYFHQWGFETSAESLKWVEPNPISSVPAITPENFDVEFELIEKALSSIQLDHNGEVILQRHTTDILEKAIEHIPENASTEYLQRISFLISNMFPQNSSKQVLNLTLGLRQFNLALNHINKTQPQIKTAEEAEARLIENTKLRYKYLGKDATEKLFSKHQAMALYVIKRRKVLKDQNLSLEQRQSQLHKIELTLKDKWFIDSNNQHG